MLRSKDIGEVHEVTPVLVIWGRASEDVPTCGRLQGDVHVLAGAELVEWLNQRPQQPRVPWEWNDDLMHKLEMFA